MASYDLRLEAHLKQVRLTGRSACALDLFLVFMMKINSNKLVLTLFTFARRSAFECILEPTAGQSPQPCRQLQSGSD